MDLTYINAIIMGIIQGLTEFLPVSSSGHLVMFQHLWGIDPEKPEMILFDLAVHVGTVASILYYYRKSISRFFFGLNRDKDGLLKPISLYKSSPSWKFFILSMFAMFATAVFYVSIKVFGKLAGETDSGKDIFEIAFSNPNVVSILWLVTAGVLLITDKKRKTRRGLKNFTITCALIIGLAQGIAMLPGISRSGSTICACVLLGLHRRWAGEFSFLIGVMAIVGATLIESIKFFSGTEAILLWGPVIVGSVISGIVGFMALSMLLWAVRKAKLKVFAVYLVIVSISSLIYFNMFHQYGPGIENETGQHQTTQQALEGEKPVPASTPE